MERKLKKGGPTILVLRQTDDSTVVTRTIHIAAKPETVFAFFIDPVKMRQWKGISATLNPQPGGQFRVELSEQVFIMNLWTSPDGLNQFFTSESAELLLQHPAGEWIEW
jgi:hypothetical protein